jgi:hypothetical protein
LVQPCTACSCYSRYEYRGAARRSGLRHWF